MPWIWHKNLEDHQQQEFPKHLANRLSLYKCILEHLSLRKIHHKKMIIIGKLPFFKK